MMNYMTLSSLTTFQSPKLGAFLFLAPVKGSGLHFTISVTMDHTRPCWTISCFKLETNAT